MTLQWEYRLLQMDGDLTASWLNEQGQDGWELVAVEEITRTAGVLMPIRVGYSIIFKRQVPQDVIRVESDFDRTFPVGKKRVPSEAARARSLANLAKAREARQSKRTERMMEVGGKRIPWLQAQAEDGVLESDGNGVNDGRARKASGG